MTGPPAIIETLLSDGVRWFNAEPPRPQDLLSTVLVLVFFHGESPADIDAVVRIEQSLRRYGGSVECIAVHSPKFDYSRSASHAAHLARSFGMALPLIHDPGFKIWRELGIASWPSVALIDGQGTPIGVFAGAPDAAVLHAALEDLLENPQATPDRRPYFAAARVPRLADVLVDPVAIAASPQRLYVADAARHRVLELTHAGLVVRQFGLGTADFIDGPATAAAFNRPSGLALAGEQLWVVDTGNHAVRLINLRTDEVETVLGEGEARAVVTGISQSGDGTGLNLPSALSLLRDRILIASTGNQQIVAWDLRERSLELVAGCGRLEHRDGTYGAASFADPVATVHALGTIYCLDRASSALRVVDSSTGAVRTMVGSALFDFGDTDGTRGEARMQAPSGLALDTVGSVLWIADTGNGSIRRLRIMSGELTTFEIAEPLQAPTAIACDAQNFWILDRGRPARIVHVDRDTGLAQPLSIGE